MKEFNVSELSYGKISRLESIFRDDGRALIVAMDHGMTGVFDGLENIETIAEKVIKGGADGLLVTPAAAKYLIKKGIKKRTPLIFSIPYDIRYVELAIKLDADAVKTTYFGPIPIDQQHMKLIWGISQSCDELGMPHMAEIVPADEKGKIIYDIEKIKHAARIGAELGGDIVKTPYVGPPSKYKEVVNYTFVPITIMGGPKIESIRDVLIMVKEAIDAGTTGGTIGRNIWQNNKPDKIVKALSSIIHEDKDVDEALKLID